MAAVLVALALWVSVTDLCLPIVAALAEEAFSAKSHEPFDAREVLGLEPRDFLLLTLAS